MDRQAIAEDVVGLWDMIGDAWRNKHEGTCKTEVHISLFERAHTYIIHQNIQKERSSVPSQQSSDTGPPPSEKQLKYLGDLLEAVGRDLEELTTIKTSKQASALIQELKEG